MEVQNIDGPGEESRIGLASDWGSFWRNHWGGCGFHFYGLLMSRKRLSLLQPWKSSLIMSIHDFALEVGGLSHMVE